MKRYMLMLLVSAGTLVTGLESHAQDSAGREQAVEAIRKLGGEVIVDSAKPGTAEQIPHGVV